MNDIKLNIHTEDGAIVAVEATGTCLSGHTLLTIENALCDSRPDLATFLRSASAVSIGTGSVLWDTQS